MSIGLLYRLIKEKFLLIAILTLSFSLISVLYALSIDRYYKAELLMVSSLESSAQSSLLGGLFGQSESVSLSSEKITTEEAVAILQSRRFLENHIEEKELLIELFPGSWDKAKNEWKEDIDEIPSISDGYKLISDSLALSYDNSLITVELVFHDKKSVSKILNDLIYEVNSFIRMKAIKESQDNISYLEQEINSTQLSRSKDMLYRLVESQTQSIMLANTRQDYAFNLIDPSVEPIHPAGPNRRLIVVIGTIVGFSLSLFCAFLINFYYLNKSS